MCVLSGGSLCYVRQRRLRWFGQIGWAEGSLLNEVEKVRIGGRQPVRRPKTKQRVCLTEDMNTLEKKECTAQDSQLWKAVITSPTPF